MKVFLATRLDTRMAVYVHKKIKEHTYHEKVTFEP